MTGVPPIAAPVFCGVGLGGAAVVAIDPLSLLAVGFVAFLLTA